MRLQDEFDDFEDFAESPRKSQLDQQKAGPKEFAKRTERRVQKDGSDEQGKDDLENNVPGTEACEQDEWVSCCENARGASTIGNKKSFTHPRKQNRAFLR